MFKVSTAKQWIAAVLTHSQESTTENQLFRHLYGILNIKSVVVEMLNKKGRYTPYWVMVMLSIHHRKDFHFSNKQKIAYQVVPQR